MSPFFSIIIPTYNRVAALTRAINSVLNQSYEDFELIVVDDGSTDNTKQVVDGLSDDRIHYLRQPNGGVSKARNFGASKATGQYLIFLDSDDEFMNDYLTEVESCSKDNPDIVFIGVEIWVNGQLNKEINARMPYGKFSENGLYLAGTFIVKKEIFDKAGGYDDKIKYGENTELSYRLAPLLTRKKFSESQLLRINQLQAGRESVSPINLVESTGYVLKKHEVLFRKDRNARRLLNQVAGVASLRLHQYATARKYLSIAFLLNPLNVKTLIRFLLACFPFLSRMIYK